MRWKPHISAPLTAAILSLGGLQGCSSEDSPAAREPSDRELDEAEVEVGHTVPPGTSLVFSVDQIVSTATHARGDVFSATLRHRVTDVEGSEAIPEGVPSQWIVTEASTEDGATVLAIRLESIRVNGSWTPLVGDVTEAHLRTSSADSVRTSGADVAVGPEANAVLVEIFGEDSAAAGTAGADAGTAGTMVTLTTRGRSATLPAGSDITVQLTEPLEV
jgi:hypothetical protein